MYLVQKCTNAYFNIICSKTEILYLINIIIYMYIVQNVYGEVHHIRHDVIKFVSDMRRVDGFLFTNNIDRHDITEIVLTMV